MAIAKTTLAKWREWKLKPRNKDFPLTVSPNGQWVKKIKGFTYCFGVLADPKAAKDRYLRELPYLRAGMDIPEEDDLAGSITLAALCRKHLDRVASMVESGERSVFTFDNYSSAEKKINAVKSICDRPIDSLTPEDWGCLRAKVVGNGLSFRSQKNVITAIRSIVKWGGDMECCTKTPRYGPNFQAPDAMRIEIQQEENSAVRFIERETILAALDVVNPKMKVAILLGINCGFYGSDSACIQIRHLHLDVSIPFHDFRRVKTGRKRKAVLWPETVDAIRDYIENHRRPKNPQEKILLLSHFRKAHEGKAINSALMNSFDRIMKGLGFKDAGVSIGSLRHTYGTIMDLSGDQQMIALTMGHTPKTLQQRIYSQLNLSELERLKKVADVVHGWLFDGEI